MIPYEIVSVEAYHLFDKAITVPYWESNFYFDMYHSLLESSGWTDKRLDEETLRRVSLYWELVSFGKVVPINMAKSK